MLQAAAEWLYKADIKWIYNEHPWPWLSVSFNMYDDIMQPRSPLFSRSIFVLGKLSGADHSRQQVQNELEHWFCPPISSAIFSCTFASDTHFHFFNHISRSCLFSKEESWFLSISQFPPANYQLLTLATANFNLRDWNSDFRQLLVLWWLSLSCRADSSIFHFLFSSTGQLFVVVVGNSHATTLQEISVFTTVNG